MTDNVPGIQCHKGNSLDVLSGKHSGGHIQTGHGSLCKILLRRIAGNHGMRSEAKARQEHLHLFRSRVLCFIKNNVCIVERSSAHIGKRRHFNQPLLHIRLKLFRAHNLIKSIVKRTKVRIHLALKISRKKTELFTGLNGRSCQNDPLYFLVLKCRNRHCHCKKCLSRSGRTVGKNNQIIPNRFDIFLLPDRLRLDGLSGRRVTNHFAVQCGKKIRIFLGFLFHFKHIIHVLLLNAGAPFCKTGQLIQRQHSLADSLFSSGNKNCTVSGKNGYPQLIFDSADIVVPLTENFSFNISFSH